MEGISSRGEDGLFSSVKAAPGIGNILVSAVISGGRPGWRKEAGIIREENLFQE